MLNKCIFIAEMVSKKIITTKTGKPMLLFTVRTWDAENKSEFIECVAYNKQAELIDRDFPKGRNIYLETKAHSYKDDSSQLRVQFVLMEFRYLTKEVKNDDSERFA